MMNSMLYCCVARNGDIGLDEMRPTRSCHRSSGRARCNVGGRRRLCLAPSCPTFFHTDKRRSYGWARRHLTIWGEREWWDYRLHMMVSPNNSRNVSRYYILSLLHTHSWFAWLSICGAVVCFALYFLLFTLLRLFLCFFESLETMWVIFSFVTPRSLFDCQLFSVEKVLTSCQEEEKTREATSND